jgi:hypothetical protein
MVTSIKESGKMIWLKALVHLWTQMVQGTQVTGIKIYNMARVKSHGIMDRLNT